VAGKVKQSSGGCPMWAVVIGVGRTLHRQATDYCEAMCDIRLQFPLVSRGKLCFGSMLNRFAKGASDKASRHPKAKKQIG